MNDLITLDHKSCYNPTGRWEASGEWQASPNVLIYLRSYGVAKGPEIVWEYEITSVELYEGEELATSAYPETWTTAPHAADWRSGKPIDSSYRAALWMLGVAYCWAMKSADDWADKNAEPIAE